MSAALPHYLSTPAAIVVAALIVAGLITIAVVITVRWRRRVAAATRTWKQSGLPPPDGVDVATRILQRRHPELGGGSCEWVDAPWDRGYGGPGFELWTEGAVLSLPERKIRCMRREFIEQTTYAHEWEELATGEKAHTPEALARIAEANAEIAAALGRST